MSEFNSNFHLLSTLKLGPTDARVVGKRKWNRAYFKSRGIENEILEIMSHKVLPEIMGDIKILCNIL